MACKFWISHVAAGALTLAVLMSCDSDLRSGGPGIDARDIASTPGPALHPALSGTVMEFARLDLTDAVRVEGFGMVGDLPGTGSGDMPPPVRVMLADQLYRMGAGSHIRGTSQFNPDTILASGRVAAVAVQGFIPPMSPKGTRFDLEILALPNTQTTSLVDGLLWSAELKQVGLVEGDATTATISRGRGPVFCVPNLDGENEKKSRNVRSGRILSGGVTQIDMPAQLLLYTPSYRVAALVQRAINARYPARPQLAESKTDSTVMIRIPPEYTDRPGEFMDSVLHLSLANDVPGYSEKKSKEMLQALLEPNAPHKDLSLALEMMGRTIIPELRTYYVHPQASVRYYAARAGAGMMDLDGLVVLEEFAQDSQSPFQLDAVRNLAAICARNIAAGRGDESRTSLALMKAVNSQNLKARLAAYEGMVQIKSQALRSFGVAGRFYMDRVIADGDQVIYATVNGLPRIALLGRQFNLPLGVLHVSADNVITVSVAEKPILVPQGDGKEPKDETVTLYFRRSGEKAVQLKCGRSLPIILATLAYTPDPLAEDYNPKQEFIGANYQRVVEMLSALCRDKSINATFVLQKPATQYSLANAADQQVRPETRPANDP
ncbi:MAG: flagellar basal body P-ring protein FlgI [Phycisphaerae bacterium]